MSKSYTKIYDLSDEEFATVLDLEPEHTLQNGPRGSIVKAHSKKDPSKKQVVKLLWKRTPDELNKNRRAFFNEVQSIVRLNHPNVVSDIKSVICPSYFAICTNFYFLGNLAGMIPRLPRAGKELYMAQITCAVHYIHSQGVAHLDLNPKHVLIDVQGNAVITDFGSSRILLKPRNIVVHSGVEGYRAPEMSNPGAIDPFKADIYSMGAIVWNMLFQMTPNKHLIDHTLIHADEIKLKENAVFRFVLFGTLSSNPERRLSSDRLLRKLKEYLPALSNMITKLMNHDSLPPITSENVADRNRR